MHFFITGHTGFKGSWLAMWLELQGHRVSGLALDPEPGSLFVAADVASLLTNDVRTDIRDSSAVAAALSSASPDVVIHMAAQPLVRRSYEEPRWTFETNVLGTLNVLEAVSRTPSVVAHLVVTTDKVYRSANQSKGYAETDQLGGDDPYSASKAMADMLTHAWVSSFGGSPTAIARGGNVIGGGDVSQDRLVPDLKRAVDGGQSPVLRYPEAVRPWQHVLDCLNGYLALIDLMVDDFSAAPDQGAWNFGPTDTEGVTVGEIATRALRRWGSLLNWVPVTEEQQAEASRLVLDVGKARRLLGWRDLLSCDRAVDWTVDWHVAVGQGADPRGVSLDQIRAFEQLRLNDVKRPEES